MLLPSLHVLGRPPPPLPPRDALEPSEEVEPPYGTIMLVEPDGGVEPRHIGRPAGKVKGIGKGKGTGKSKGKSKGKVKVKVKV